MERPRSIQTAPEVQSIIPRTLPLAAARPHLAELVEGMTPGEELVLTRDGEPVAIVTRPSRTSWPCEPGTARNSSVWMAPDFNAPLEDFDSPVE